MRIKKFCAAALMSVGLVGATPSSAVVIGGIDFGALGAVAHIETATLAETFVNAPGHVLSGYGFVTTVNGNNNYCAGGGSNCALYYYFTGYTVTSFSPTLVKFTGGTVDVYYDANPAINLLGQSSPANVAFIQSLTLWASMTGHTFFDPLNPVGTQTLLGTGSLTGPFLSATGTGQLDVVPGVGVAGVAAYLDGNSVPDLLGGFADMILTSSANNLILNPFDVAGGFATGCQAGTAAAGAWCQAGTLNVRGLTRIPEPSSLALLGLGLLGFAWFSRKSRA